MNVVRIHSHGVLVCFGQVKRVGVCDAQTRSRVGPGAELIDNAESVHVFDHHVDRDSDILNAELRIEQ